MKATRTITNGMSVGPDDVVVNDSGSSADILSSDYGDGNSNPNTFSTTPSPLQTRPPVALPLSPRSRSRSLSPTPRSRSRSRSRSPLQQQQQQQQQQQHGGFSSSSSSNSESSLLNIHKKNYQCPQCDHPPYPGRSGLWNHMKSKHSDETEAEKTSRKIKKAAENKTFQERKAAGTLGTFKKPKNTYFCDRCGKDCKQKSNLDAHKKRKKPCANLVSDEQEEEDKENLSTDLNLSGREKNSKRNLSQVKSNELSITNSCSSPPLSKTRLDYSLDCFTTDSAEKEQIANTYNPLLENTLLIETPLNFDQNVHSIPSSTFISFGEQGIGDWGVSPIKPRNVNEDNDVDDLGDLELMSSSIETDLKSINDCGEEVSAMTLKSSSSSSSTSLSLIGSKSASKNSKGGRKKRCGICDGCTTKECETCKYCLDQKKRGGSNTSKRACLLRVCTNPIIIEWEMKDEYACTEMCTKTGTTCTYSTKRKGDFDQHKKTHGEKNFVCTVPGCKYKGVTSSNLWKHSKTNCGERLAKKAKAAKEAQEKLELKKAKKAKAAQAAQEKVAKEKASLHADLNGYGIAEAEYIELNLAELKKFYNARIKEKAAKEKVAKEKASLHADLNGYGIAEAEYIELNLAELKKFWNARIGKSKMVHVKNIISLCEVLQTKKYDLCKWENRNVRYLLKHIDNFNEYLLKNQSSDNLLDVKLINFLADRHALDISESKQLELEAEILRLQNNQCESVIAQLARKDLDMNDVYNAIAETPIKNMVERNGKPVSIGADFGGLFQISTRMYPGMENEENEEKEEEEEEEKAKKKKEEEEEEKEKPLDILNESINSLAKNPEMRNRLRVTCAASTSLKLPNTNSQVTILAETSRMEQEIVRVEFENWVIAFRDGETIKRILKCYPKDVENKAIDFCDSNNIDINDLDNPGFTNESNRMGLSVIKQGPAGPYLYPTPMFLSLMRELGGVIIDIDMSGNAHDADNIDMDTADEECNYEKSNIHLDVLESVGQRRLSSEFDQKLFQAYAPLINKHNSGRKIHKFRTAVKGLIAHRERYFQHLINAVGTSLNNSAAQSALKDRMKDFEKLQFGEKRRIKVGIYLQLHAPSQSGKMSGPKECRFKFTDLM